MNHVITFNLLATETRHDASGMATKADVADVKADLADVKAELKEDIADVRSDIRLLKWMMGFMLAGIASLLAKSFF